MEFKPGDKVLYYRLQTDAWWEGKILAGPFWSSGQGFWYVVRDLNSGHDGTAGTQDLRDKDPRVMEIMDELNSIGEASDTQDLMNDEIARRIVARLDAIPEP